MTGSDDIAPNWQKALTVFLSAIYFVEATLLLVVGFVGLRVTPGPDGGQHMMTYLRLSAVHPLNVLLYLAAVFSLFAGTRWAARRDRSAGLMLLAILVTAVNLPVLAAFL